MAAPPPFPSPPLRCAKLVTVGLILPVAGYCRPLPCARSWGETVETIGDFVSRTGGPVVPFVAAWYPWAYAHHYLRGEIAQLPGELGTVGTSLSLEEARNLIELWCGHTGESIEDGARRLADAYLRRWGLHPSEPPTPSATQGTGATQA